MTEPRKEFPPRDYKSVEFQAAQFAAEYYCYPEAEAHLGEKIKAIEDTYIRVHELLTEEHTAILEQERERSRELIAALAFIKTDNYKDSEGIVRPTLSAKIAMDALNEYRSGEGIK